MNCGFYVVHQMATYGDLLKDRTTSSHELLTVLQYHVKIITRGCIFRDKALVVLNCMRFVSR